MNIYQITLSELDIKKEFLDNVTEEKLKLGKKGEYYWIINATYSIRNNENEFDAELHKLNMLLAQIAGNGFNYLMVIDETQKSPSNIEGQNMETETDI